MDDACRLAHELDGHPHRRADSFGYEPLYLDPGYKRAVNVNPRDAGGTVSLVLDCATFSYGTFGDQGNLERGGTYTVPRELGVAIAQLGAGTLA